MAPHINVMPAQSLTVLPKGALSKVGQHTHSLLCTLMLLFPLLLSLHIVSPTLNSQMEVRTIMVASYYADQLHSTHHLLRRNKVYTNREAIYTLTFTIILYCVWAHTNKHSTRATDFHLQSVQTG